MYNLGDIIKYAKVHSSVKEGKQFIEDTKKLDNYKNESILECSLSDNSFHPLIIRTDKTNSNSFMISSLSSFFNSLRKNSYISTYSRAPNHGMRIFCVKLEYFG